MRRTQNDHFGPWVQECALVPTIVGILNGFPIFAWPYMPYQTRTSAGGKVQNRPAFPIHGVSAVTFG